ncbi:CoA transferase [Cellulosimicrobium cellulans]|uniref:CoA transferase n=1 Tax=Cellulosimicrobium cellulans TaxID=1710 RepID=UPI002406C9EF|nr:CoA transferase [Cellulosimicrobium cellulans]MDF9875872.1 crotonobetainyl-CoA:carnitine CoA-transferase CaiB-like acyl-CoA transferase [Cellulosimicrobium cellulans]
MGSTTAHPGHGLLAATLPVLDLAVASVVAVRDAAARAGRFDAGPPPDPERVAAAFASDRLLRVDGAPVDGFAPLSGFFPTADGWVRTHANYPHHRARLLALLDLPDAVSTPTRDDVAAALAVRSAQDVEDRAADIGAIAVRVRTEDAWLASAPGRATASDPPVRRSERDDAAPPRPLARGPRPLAGLRVLDLTRVIAGPVATRTLALLGADVLRVDPPRLPEIEVQHLDTGQGKQSTLLDLATHDGLARAQELLDRADVLVTGYRPGAVEAFGLRLPPGTVHARVTAWGDDGPWAGRRGFDSIVQAVSGIALVEGTRDGAAPGDAIPGALPAQALDHATGYLVAAAVVDALAGRAADGRGREIDGALARTGHALLAAPGRDPAHDAPRTPGPRCVVEHPALVDGREVVATTTRPALDRLGDARVDDYPTPARPWGADEPRWTA